MRAAEHPREAERLRAVRETGLLDGPIEGLQQATVKLASQICCTPIAAVSLIDADRQWFPAIYGLDARETPREQAFCAHAILGEVPMVVHDATKDNRFSDNPLVTGSPMIRFYAGVPLMTADQLPMGSLCVIDVQPRELTAEQIESLSTLAQLVAAHLELRRRVNEINEQDEKLKQSIAIIERQNIELSLMAERAHHAVDDVSHEFRTPLAVIKEFTSIIADGVAGPVSQEQADYLKIMDVAVVDLNHMVEDLLDSSKLRVGRLRVSRQSHNIEEIFEMGRRAFAHKASLRSIKIEEHIEPGLPQIFADEEKARRVVGNLMTNAIKFSPEGGRIELRAGWSISPGEVRISVTDHGPGLSAADIDRLFGRFQQTSTCRTTAAKGFGLGLSIAQELSWLNLSRLAVTSKKGEGATFYFGLPVNLLDAVLAAYFRTIAATDRPSDELVIFRVTSGPGETPPAQADEPGLFLSSVTYATDLVVPVPWEAASGENEPLEWWLIGRSRSPARWIERLQSSRSILVNESPFKLAPLTFESQGSWAYPAEAGRAQAAILDMVEKGEVVRAI